MVDCIDAWFNNTSIMNSNLLLRNGFSKIFGIEFLSAPGTVIK